MIGAFKCCGAGARMLRNTSAGAAAGVSSSTLDCSTYGNCTLRDYNQVPTWNNMNWSQRRFLRGQAPTTSSVGSENVNNGQFVVKEIENRGKVQFVASKHKTNHASKETDLRKYSRSLRDHQSHLITTFDTTGENSQELIAEISKLITEKGSPVVRVKNRKDEAFLKEWIGIQNELHFVKKDRIEEYKRRLQIASQQALREMEANLQKASSLDELDQAIEGALCSEAKREYTQKSLHDT